MPVIQALRTDVRGEVSVYVAESLYLRASVVNGCPKTQQKYYLCRL